MHSASEIRLNSNACSWGSMTSCCGAKTVDLAMTIAAQMAHNGVAQFSQFSIAGALGWLAHFITGVLSLGCDYLDRFLSFGVQLEDSFKRSFKPSFKPRSYLRKSIQLRSEKV